MSKLPKRTPSCRSSATVFCEKPHFGLSGLPFMKSITSWRSMSLRQRSSSSSCVSCAGTWCSSYAPGAGAGALVEESGALAPVAAGAACEATAAESAAALAPEMRESSVWPRSRTKDGTESMSKDSDTSGSDSASIWEGQGIRCDSS
jgi:hypothetical protein